MSFPRYEIYKDSGVEWLGEVPAGWGVHRVKQNSYLKGRVGWKGLNSSEFLDESYAYLVTGTDFRDKYIKWETCYQVDKFRYEDDPFIQLKNGDLLITKDGTIGKVAIVSGLDKPACLNSGIFLVRPAHSYSTDYLFWVLNSQSFSLFCDLTTYGSTIQHLYQNVFENFAFPVPPLPEQHAIAAFLDRETAKIDALIAEQQRLIALLAEKRQAVISHAVTKGLNPDAPMKDSGIEWLGEVPEHWDVVRFQRCVYVAEGQVNPEEEPYCSMILVAPNHVESGSGRLLSLETAAEQSAESGKYLCQQGDVIYSKIRPGLRKACLAPTECLCSADMYPLRAHSQMTNLFLFWFILSEPFSALAVLESDRVAMPKINRESLKAVSLPRPPLQEQHAIAGFLDVETAKLDTLTAEAQRAITLLQERRTALISAAVTGKIDVRNSMTEVP